MSRDWNSVENISSSSFSKQRAGELPVGELIQQQNDEYSCLRAVSPSSSSDDDGQEEEDDDGQQVIGQNHAPPVSPVAVVAVAGSGGTNGAAACPQLQHNYDYSLNSESEEQQRPCIDPDHGIRAGPQNDALPRSEDQQQKQLFSRSKRNREDEQSTSSCSSSPHSRGGVVHQGRKGGGGDLSTGIHSTTEENSQSVAVPDHHGEQRYEVISEIRRGACGIVKKAKDLLTGQTVAIKVTAAGVPVENDKEVLLMRSFSRDGGTPHVVRMLDYYRQNPSCSTNENENRNVVGGGLPAAAAAAAKHHIVMEYCSQDFFELTTQLAGDESLCRKFFLQLLVGLKQFHMRGMLHRDLKPENLLLRGWGVHDPEAELLIADLGSVKELDGSEQATSLVGTMPFLSPERIARQPYDFSCEIWAIGCILFCWFAKRKPFLGNSRDEVSRMQKRLRYLPQLPKSASEELRDLMAQLLAVDPNRRPTLEEVFSHPWCRGETFPTKEDVRGKKKIESAEERLLSKLSTSPAAIGPSLAGTVSSPFQDSRVFILEASSIYVSFFEMQFTVLCASGPPGTNTPDGIVTFKIEKNKQAVEDQQQQGSTASTTDTSHHNYQGFLSCTCTQSQARRRMTRGKEVFCGHTDFIMANIFGKRKGIPAESRNSFAGFGLAKLKHAFKKTKDSVLVMHKVRKETATVETRRLIGDVGSTSSKEEEEAPPPQCCLCFGPLGGNESTPSHQDSGGSDSKLTHFTTPCGQFSFAAHQRCIRAQRGDRKTTPHREAGRSGCKNLTCPFAAPWSSNTEEEPADAETYHSSRSLLNKKSYGILPANSFFEQ